MSLNNARERRSTTDRPARARKPGAAKPAKERYAGGHIVISGYDPAWPAMFEQESRRVRAVLGDLVVGIEHMGSTAVPGLPAKPVIDLLVGVTSLKEARARCIEPLQTLGYTYIAEYEAWLPAELFFRKYREPGAGPTHHLHVMEPANPRWERFIVFRDYLRAHPKAARAYAALKRGLAAQCGDDIARYRTAKHDFVETATEKALADRRRGPRTAERTRKKA